MLSDVTKRYKKIQLCEKKRKEKKNISKCFTLSLASDFQCVILVDHGLHVLRDRHDVAVAADILVEVAAVAVGEHVAAVGHVAAKKYFLFIFLKTFII
jgi:hypothetical protein